MNIKIGIVSDLHTEFWNHSHYKEIGARVQAQTRDADLILLAGDIGCGPTAIHTTMGLFPAQQVCFVAGNHEFYGFDHTETIAGLREAAHGTNVAFLHRNTFVTTIRNRAIRVLGVTLWTDFKLFNTPDISMLDGQRYLNDFKLIKLDGQKLTAHQTTLWHAEDKQWLMNELEQPFDGVTVVMTHHAPVNFAVSPVYVYDELSPCFASRLDNQLIRDDLPLVVWGHTHYSVDRLIENTRFVSSQTGYANARDSAKVETGQYGMIVEM